MPSCRQGATKCPRSATARTWYQMRRNLATVGLYDRLEGRIFSASEVEHGKPAPDLFLHAARRMGVEPSGCVVVEDSRYGVEAGRAAGMQVLAYAGGGMTPSKRSLARHNRVRGHASAPGAAGRSRRHLTPSRPDSAAGRRGLAGEWTGRCGGSWGDRSS